MLRFRTVWQIVEFNDSYNYMRTILFAFLMLFGVTAVRAQIPSVIAGPVENPGNNHLYYLLSSSTWSNSEIAAVSLGGHLATIRNTNEQIWAFSTFGNYGGIPRSLWIGFTDRRVESSFEWVSGEVVSFCNWASGEPNTTTNRTVENYVHLWPPGYDNAGYWNDLYGDTTSFFRDPNTITLYGLVEVVSTNISASLSIRQSVEVFWPSRSDRHYQVQWSSLLNTNNWQFFGSPIQGTGTTNRVFDSNEDVTPKFYRVLTLD